MKEIINGVIQENRPALKDKSFKDSRGLPSLHTMNENRPIQRNAQKFQNCGNKVRSYKIPEKNDRSQR